jgi:PHD/YefM family antitoxin component YafN of YafNO toxin-antitoxin module
MVPIDLKKYIQDLILGIKRKPIVLKHDGKEVAVIMSIEDYETITQEKLSLEDL